MKVAMDKVFTAGVAVGSIAVFECICVKAGFLATDVFVFGVLASKESASGYWHMAVAFAMVLLIAALAVNVPGVIIQQIYGVSSPKTKDDASPNHVGNE